MLMQMGIACLLICMLNISYVYWLIINQFSDWREHDFAEVVEAFLLNSDIETIQKMQTMARMNVLLLPSGIIALICGIFI